MEMHQFQLGKLLRYGSQIGYADNIVSGTGTRSKSYRWGKHGARFDLTFKDGVAVDCEVMVFVDRQVVAKYRSTDTTRQGLQLLWYHGLLVKCERLF